MLNLLDYEKEAVKSTVHVIMIASILIAFTSIILLLSASAQQIVVFYVPSDGQQSAMNQCHVTKTCSLVALLSSGILSDNVSNTVVILHPGIHTINSTVNQTFSISNVTNFTLKAADLTERATIKCNGRTGFALSFCKNLTIQGINFESCSGHQIIIQSGKTVFNNFVLLIRYSFDVNISAVMIRNSDGIGLLVINVCGSFMLFNSAFTNNTGNVCYFSIDNSASMNFTSRDTDININNSSFGWATTCRYKNPLLGIIRPAGVVLKLIQTTFKTRTRLSNIILITNESYSIAIDFKFPTNKLKIENITSVSLNDKFGMLIHAIMSSIYHCSIFETAVIIDHAQFSRSRLFITTSGKSRSCKLHMILSNILIEEVYYGNKYPLLVTTVPSIVVRDITVQNTIGTISFRKCNLQLRGRFIYQQNHGAFVLAESEVAINNTVVIIQNNTATHYAPFFILSSEIGIQKSFISVNSNTGPESGGIVLVNSTVHFTDDSQAMFLSNTGQRGGAMAFYQRSRLIFDSGITNFTFTRNYAGAKGGAIYVHDEEYVKYLNIVIRTLKEERYQNFLLRGQYSNFHFFNNSAAQAGSAVFGGSIRGNFYFHSPSVNDTSIVSSIPFKVCMCTNSKPNCNIRNITVKLPPGQSYTMEITAVGQRNGTVSSTIRAEFREHSQSQLTQTQYIQPVGKTCTNLTYTAQFSKDVELLQLIIADQIWKKKIPFYIIFNRKACTIGFVLDIKAKKCVCNQNIIDHGMGCDIQTLKINRLPLKWINVTYEHLDPTIRQPGVIIHDYCPFDYCLANSQQLDLHYPDQQCKQNRAGILCGACSRNFSHVLGTSKCKQCTTPWISLIMPFIAVTGIVLVVGLLFLNLTVSVGTINGFIFYINIVQANNSLFFSQSISESMLSMFIAWLNLDLGIEMCFYSGLDAYSKTWFQFLFPLYIWFMLGAIIVVSHYSTLISRLVGDNAVQVLATLFLLSYAKLLRIIITVFSSTELIYPDDYHRRVWLYDGNVDYLKGKHIPLFIAALILLIFISFPFTMVVLCTQCMQKLSNKRLLSWVGKFQPLFDAYTGPYKIKHRYWTGLLLLIRVCLFLVFSLNTIGNPMINLLAICIAMSCLLAYLSLIGGVYKQWWLNVIKTAFILNLLVLSLGSIYQINTGTSIKPITYTSTGITFVIFICILIYHFILEVMKRKFAQIIKSKLTKSNYLRLLTIAKLRSSNQNELGIRFKPSDEVTYSEVKLEQPLLELD